jgi:hypothetical protein
VGVLDEEVEMCVNVHVNDDGSIVDDVVMQIFKVLLSIAQLFNTLYQLFLFSVVKSLTFPVHVSHSLVLKVSASIVCRVACLSEKFLPLLAGLVMVLLL